MRRVRNTNGWKKGFDTYTRTCKYCKESFKASSKLGRVCEECRKEPGGGVKVLVKTSKQISNDVKYRDKNFRKVKWLKQEDAVRLVDNIRAIDFRKGACQEDMEKYFELIVDIKESLKKEFLRKHKKSLDQLLKIKNHEAKK